MVSGGWSTAPPQDDQGRARPRVRWWPLLIGAVVVLAAVLVAWRPWADGAPAVGAPTGSAGAPTPSPFPTELTPDPDVTSPADGQVLPTAPGAGTVFDVAAAQELFVSAEQIAGALPSDAPTLAPTKDPAPRWGLPNGATVVPARCLVARTVVTAKPAGYMARSWAGGDLTYRQEVTLLPGAEQARHAFATLVGTVDACAQYTEVDPGGGQGRWTTQPAIEGQGLYPSIVQAVTLEQKTATTNGYRGHLLVGNAIVTWTAWSTGSADALGQPDDLSAILQDRALAAVRAAG